MKDEMNKKFLVTEIGDIIYNPANVVFGALHKNKYAKGCLSPIYRIFYSDFDTTYLECIMRSDAFIQALSQKTEGTVVKLKTLKPEAFLGMKIFVTTSVEEQKKIAKYFEYLDNLITLHQRKCDELKLLKKGMLQKMFPKEGEKKPEIRFPGFTDDWEQRKLDSLAEIKTGYPFDSEAFNESGKYLVITNGNIQNESEKVNPCVGNHIDITDNKILETYLLNINDILVTMDGTVGRTAKVADNGLILAQRVGRLIPINNAEFLYQWLNTGKFFNDMKDLSHGGTIKHISLKEIGSYTAYIPTNEEEQCKIGNYFASLDNLITLHQRKCDAWKIFKKSMLQQMFV